MRGINICIFGGNLGRDPEIRYTPDGKKVASFSLALSRKFKLNGMDRNAVTWIRVVCFDRVAEDCERMLSKGDEVVVTGSLAVKEWEDIQSGENKKSYEVQASAISFVTVKKWKGGKEA